MTPPRVDRVQGEGGAALARSGHGRFSTTEVHRHDREPSRQSGSS
jgi:hypothetical protein